MKEIDDWVFSKEKNICLHFGEKTSGEFNPIVPPIVQTSTFSFDKYEDFISISKDEKHSYMYTRGTNPTTEILEKKLAKLEGGEKCKVFSSGMAAITSTLMTLLKKGDHLLSLNTIYGQANKFMKLLPNYGIEYTNIQVSTLEDIKKSIKTNTKIIYMESPSSQFMQLLDLDAISKLAKEKNIITVIDNTWATPICQNPISHGIDIVLHSCSKYIGGNSDVVAGAVISTNEIVDQIFEFGHQNFGAVISPFDSWLLIRGLRTLPLRIEYQANSVKKVIEFLLQDNRIKTVYHPYCREGEQRVLAKKYLKCVTSLLSFVIREDNFEKLINFVNKLKIFQIGVSWGGHESLILPAFKGVNEEQLKERNMSKMHVRLYIGLEDPDSLIQDLKQALDEVYPQK